MKKQYRYDYDLYGFQDDFLPKPTLFDGFKSNPLKGLLLLGSVYIAGALIGKDRSLTAGKFAARKGLGVAQSAASFTADRLRKAGGNKNIVMTAKQLESYRR